MGLFGSAMSAEYEGIQVAVVPTGDATVTLMVNGLPYGRVKKGTTKDKDSMVVNEALPENQVAEALCGLAALLAGGSVEEISRLIGDFRKWNQGNV